MGLRLKSVNGATDIYIITKDYYFNRAETIKLIEYCLIVKYLIVDSLFSRKICRFFYRLWYTYYCGAVWSKNKCPWKYGMMYGFPLYIINVYVTDLRSNKSQHNIGFTENIVMLIYLQLQKLLKWCYGYFKMYYFLS